MDDLQKRIDRLTPEQRKLFNRRLKEMEKKDEKSEILLTIQEGRPDLRRPLYCMYPPLGVTGYYINIVLHLHPHQPVYGVQSPAFYPGTRPL